MLKNYLTVALRHLWRHRTISLINVMGMAVGLASAALILLYLQFEFSFDQYHSKKDNIYRLVTKTRVAAFDAIAKVPGPWGNVALEEVPEVQEVTRFVLLGEQLITRDNKRFYESGGLFADSTVFRMFDHKILFGDGQSALTEPNTVVIDEELAAKYFGTENPVGETLIFDNTEAYTVTAVVGKVPENSHFTFRFLLSMSSYDHARRDSWTWLQYYTYVLLNPGSELAEVEDKFAAALRPHLPPERADGYVPFLQPLTKIHLHSKLFREMSVNSDISTMYLLAVIAAFVLIIACINFMNLATARSATRAKEVGVRKVSGAGPGQLIVQFMGEAILLAVFALVIALVIIEFLLPAFNSLVGRQLSFNYVDNWLFLFTLVGIALTVGVFSGSYPAFVLSAIKPTRSIKGQSGSSGQLVLRKGLVVLQFAISIALIIATGMVYMQIDYIASKRLGFETEQIVVVPIRDNAVRTQHEALKNELSTHPNIISVAVSGNLLGGGDFGIPYEPEGFADGEAPAMRVMAVDHNFTETYDMEVVQGRHFSQEFATDQNSYLINEEAARQLGWENPLVKTIAMSRIDRTSGPIVGVVKDFHFRSIEEKIGPIMMFIPPDGWFSYFSVRVQPTNIDETLGFLETTFAKFDPSHPFDYSFLSDRFERLYASIHRIGELLSYFAFLAIIVACLGLFGLATFAAERRTKEIGIRKVLGASISSVTTLLSRDFLLLVVLANLIAWPAAWFMVDMWLREFAYHTDINWWVFAIAGFLAMLIAGATISIQAVRAALANPVEALRYE